MIEAKLAVQLYTLRESGLDFDGMLGAVAAVGYDGVETVGSHSLAAAEMRAALERHGLEGCSSHVPLTTLEGDFAGTTEFFGEAGISTLVVPFLSEGQRPRDAEGWTALGERLGELARRCRDQGLELLYHNHDFEFEGFAGEPALDLIMRASEPLGLELDLGWAVRSGADPYALLSRYRGRVRRVHVKDVAVGGGAPEEGGWADVGRGSIDWPPLLREARSAGAEWLVVEHDRPLEPVASVQRSAEYLRSLSGLG